MVVRKKHPSTLNVVKKTISSAPVVRWTRYGRWSPDGQFVLNAAGDIIYPFIQRKTVHGRSKA